MNFLRKLSVAENIFILKGSSSTLQELLKLTFIDLLLKQVITAQKGHSDIKPGIHNIYIDKGARFHSHKPNKHETVLLQGLYYSPKAALQLRYFMRLAIRSAQSKKQFHENLILQPGYRKLFKYKFLQKLFGSTFLSGEGIIAKKEIQKELLATDKLYTEYLKNNPSKIQDIILDIAGNICLLPSFDMNSLRQLDVLTVNEIRKYDAESNWSDSVWDIPIEILWASDWGTNDNSDSFWDILIDD